MLPNSTDRREDFSDVLEKTGDQQTREIAVSSVIIAEETISTRKVAL